MAKIGSCVFTYFISRANIPGLTGPLMLAQGDVYGRGAAQGVISGSHRDP
jgi:hypothetical protein